MRITGVQESENGGIREYNERLILHAIRQHGEIPSAELVRKTGLSVQSVSRITKRLIDFNLIEKRDRRRVKGKVGQPSVPLALKADGAYSIGVKIGRKSLDIVAMDFSGTIQESAVFEYDFPEPSQVVAASIDGISEILSRLTKSRRERVVGLGVVAPYGLADRHAELKSPASLAEEWAKTDLRAAIAETHDLRIWEDHDAKAACLADLLLHGVGARPKNYLFLFLGTIMSGGVVLDGTLVRGPHGYAGAIGPLPVPGGLALLERDRQALVVPLLRVASRYVLNEMLLSADLDPGKILFTRTSCEHDAVRKWADYAARALAIGILSAISTFDFDAVVIDGDLPSEVREYLVERLRESLDEQDFTGLVRPELLVGDLGNRARALGGALLPFYSNYVPERDLLVKPLVGGFGDQ
ncbi:MAG: ROK family transcriptional regulator [Albidovulum sp.]|nr:ROK family transcriptional regulator [Albidovulum sp.]